MAYMSQEKKAALAPAIKAVLSKYGMKGTIAVRNHSTLVINIKEGPLDIIGNANEVYDASPRGMAERATRQPLKDHVQVNEFWIGEHYSGKVRDFLVELKEAANKGNHDRSDIQTDYFDVGWYVNINVGQWNKPYVLNKA